MLGLALIDGAFSYIGQFPFVTIVFFVAVICDLAAGITIIPAMFLLRTRKRKKSVV